MPRSEPNPLIVNFRPDRELVEIMLKPHHIKAARELLRWSQEDCAKHAGISIETLRRLEVGGGQPQKDTVHAVLSAFEKAGVRVGEQDRLTLEPPDAGAVSPSA